MIYLKNVYIIFNNDDSIPKLKKLGTTKIRKEFQELLFDVFYQIKFWNSCTFFFTRVVKPGIMTEQKVIVKKVKLLCSKYVVENRKNRMRIIVTLVG